MGFVYIAEVLNDIVFLARLLLFIGIIIQLLHRNIKTINCALIIFSQFVDFLIIKYV